MRQFIRHPSDIPIEILFAPHRDYETKRTHDVSFGGLAFFSDTAIAPDCIVALRIPTLQPAFEVPAARVTWCQKVSSRNAIGVQFLDSAEAYRVRMIEQVCHIESYRQQVVQREGRQLSTEEAADEWISRYASSFPNP